MDNTMHKNFRWPIAVLAVLLAIASPLTFAAVGEVNLTATGVGYFALILFAIAYMLVMAEEMLHLRKSKPVLVAAGLIWILIGIVYANEIGRASCRERV